MSRSVYRRIANAVLMYESESWRKLGQVRAAARAERRKRLKETRKRARQRRAMQREYLARLAS